MFEPQGTGFFLLLLVVFGGLLIWVALVRQLVFRILAGCLAFLPAMVFGVAAVNKFYDYYQTWGGMINDLTGQGASSIPKYAAPGAGTNKQFDKNIGRVTSTAEDAQVGYLFQTSVAGVRSHLTRDVYVYLPPQYFQKRYAHYKFPVIELLHGSPGNPQAWVDVMGVIPTFLSLLGTHPERQRGAGHAGHRRRPAVRAAVPQQPGRHPGHDLRGAGCARGDRADRPRPAAGPRLGAGRRLEGGYCAANIALQDPAGYGAAGVLSGYFSPVPSQVPAGDKPGGKPRVVNVFAGRPALQQLNSPRWYITRVPINDELPAFWLAAGVEDRQDVTAAMNFKQLLLTRVANVPLDIVPGGGHQGSVWRAALDPMLKWMTPQLAQQAAKADAAAARAAAARKAAAERKKAHTTPSSRPPRAPAGAQEEMIRDPARPR